MRQIRKRVTKLKYINVGLSTFADVALLDTYIILHKFVI